MRGSIAAAVLLSLMLASSPALAAGPCARHDGSLPRDVLWQQGSQKHSLIGRVLKGEQPIAISNQGCERSPFQQLIVELWNVIRGGGIVLLGEVHDNPEHHAARGDILWPRLEGVVSTKGLRPAAVFEHIRTDQQPQLDTFYAQAARSRGLPRAPDLLRVLAWDKSGWPDARMYAPLFDAALQAKQPIFPGNAVRERMRALVRGEAPPSDEEIPFLKLAQDLPLPLVDALAAELEGSHCGVLPARAIPGMGLAQRYTDAHLADAVAKAAEKHKGAFQLAGNGHVRTDRGVPWYLRQTVPQRKVVSVMLLEVEEGQNAASTYLPKAPDGAAASDYVMFTPRQDRPDPCEKMRGAKP